jgi:hypothetical protein
MIRHAGRTTRFTLAIAAAAALLGVFASCEGGYSDGLFNYSIPESDSDISSLIPVPIRREYFVNSEFNKREDLAVWAVFPNGETELLSVDKVDVSIVEGGEEIHLGQYTYVFTQVGERLVNLYYAKQKARYAVQVINRSSTDPSNPSLPDDGGGTTVIIINIIP